MVVNKVVQSPEERVEEQENVKGKKDAVAKDILSSLDLPETVEELENKENAPAPDPEDEGTPKEEGADIEVGDSVSFKGENEEAVAGKIVKIDEEKNEITVEDEEGQEYTVSSEDLTPAKGAPAKKEAEDGDLIPKSKHEKVIKRLEKRISTLSREMKVSKATASKTDTRDPDVVKLEAKSVPELNTLKRTVRIEQAKLARAEETEENNTKLNQLVDLELKIDQAIVSSPQRYMDTQISLYNEKAQEVYEDPDIDDIDAAAPIIKKIAQQIFRDYPKLQNVPDGQALALGLAVDHYKVIQKESSGKSKIKDLKRAAHKIKKKTSLDTSKLKGNIGKARIAALRNKAFRGGTSYDKQNLILHDPRFNIAGLIPDEYKG